MTPYTIYNTTLLRSYLSHLQSLIRTLCGLDFERANHPDAAANPLPESTARKEMRETWELLSRQLVELIGPEAELKPFSELGRPGTFARNPETDPDPFRITFKALKKKADKHRLKNPDFTLLASYDVEASARPGDPDG